MSETIQTVIAVSVAIIAIYFLLLSVLTVLAYLKLRSLRRYVEKLIKEKERRGKASAINFGKETCKRRYYVT